MTKRLRATLLLVGLALSLRSDCVCAAQHPKQVPPAPIPPPILTAKKVFIANGGGDQSLFDTPQYSGGPDRLYNEFYAAMKSWGRYELVDTPAEADLVFEIRMILVQFMRSDKPLEYKGIEYDSQFHLTIRDARTRETLWGLTEHAQTALLQSNRDKNFEQALAGIVSELQRIAGPPQAPPKPPAS
jgi:hypothetical protein